MKTLKCAWCECNSLSLSLSRLKTLFAKQGSVKGCFRNVKYQNSHIDLKRMTSSGVSFGCDSHLMVGKRLNLMSLQCQRSSEESSTYQKTTYTDGLDFSLNMSFGFVCLCRWFVRVTSPVRATWTWLRRTSPASGATSTLASASGPRRRMD